MKKWHKALLAFICSFLICNLLCMAYNSGPGGLYRKNGATRIHIPNRYYIYGTEGYGILRFDKNGYNNIDGELAESYVLLMGSSQVEGVQFAQGKNMTAVLNQFLGGTKECLKAYNIAASANHFPTVVKGFKAGISEFPNSKVVIIEIGSTAFSIDELNDSLNQTLYDSSSKGSNLVDNMTVKQKFTACIKQALPLAKLIVSEQLKGIDLPEENPFGLRRMPSQEQEEDIIDVSYYNKLLNAALSLIREEYENPIIIFYHPKIELSSDGMVIVRDEETYDIFKSACERNNIIFADMGDAFIEAYESDYAVPYGFANTEMGQGHLNEDGHAIIAQELYQILMGIQGGRF